ncbi:MAG: energy transducer TonB [Bacteroidota bacterium]|nr:energy transducer TonB [Bacteroidota bacterium]
MGDVLRQQFKSERYVKQLLADSAKLTKLRTTPEGLRQVMQMLVRYPPEALRAQEQGIVYAHFEIAENGTIEQREILGSAGRALDAETRRVLALLPNATTPALVQGRPVRLSYVLPLKFVIQTMPGQQLLARIRGR